MWGHDHDMIVNLFNIFSSLHFYEYTNESNEEIKHNLLFKIHNDIYLISNAC